MAREKVKADSLSWIERQIAKIAINRLIKFIEMKSWKTTVMGVATLICAIAMGAKALLDGDPSTTINLDEIIAALVGLGLLAARDNDVTSESAGAK